MVKLCYVEKILLFCKAIHCVHVHFVHFWGVGITPKTPSGCHVSVGATQQPQRVTLTIVDCTNETQCSS